MLPLLGLLGLAPQIMGAVSGIVSAITGKPPPPEAAESPEGMAAHIDGLPPVQRAEVQLRVFEHVEAMERKTTERWLARMAMEGAAGAEKIRASARPRIALQAMGVIRVFALVLIWALVMLTLEWLARAGLALWGCHDSPGPDDVPVEICRQLPAGLSVTALLAQLAPVTTIIWPPLLASLAACVAVIKAYMGARERDKARADEMEYGKPISSTAATVAAAGGTIAGIIRAVRG